MSSLRVSSRRTSVAIVCLLAAGVVHADWPTDPALTFVVGGGPGDQSVPKVARTSNGGAYVGWVDFSGNGQGKYRLQRLSAAGEELWGPNGLLVSDHPQNTFVTNWDLIADDEDACVLVFADIRDGGDDDVFAYRIGPDQSFLWGPDGVQLSDNDNDDDVSPQVCQTNDGAYVVAWIRTGAVAERSVRAQRLSREGTPQWTADGERLGVTGEQPIQVAPVAGAEGSAILAWLRNSATFTSPRHVRMQRLDVDGKPEWENGAEGQVVFDAGSVSLGTMPRLVPDGNGGALVAWQWPIGSQLQCAAQWLDAEGVEQFPHNGSPFGVTPSRSRTSPSIAFDPASGETLAFWNDQDPNQTFGFVAMQRFSPAGDRQLGDAGLQLTEDDDLSEGFIAAHLVEGGAIVSFTKSLAFGSPNSDLLAFRVDRDGAFLWKQEIVDVNVAVSSKFQNDSEASPDGSVVIGWTDSTDSNNVAAARVNLDGAVGPPVFADLNGDGIVNGADLGILIAGFGGPGLGDLNRDGVIDGADLGELLAAWTRDQR